MRATILCVFNVCVKGGGVLQTTLSVFIRLPVPPCSRAHEVIGSGIQCLVSRPAFDSCVSLFF